MLQDKLRNGIVQENNSVELLSREELLRRFRNPFCEYGPIDCWWWEAGHLSKEKMRWQLEEMKEKGIAGVWFYPRFVYGEPLSSDPPYWTEEWWDFVKFSVEELRRLGMQAWVSDWTDHQYFQNRLREKRKENPKLTGRRLCIYERESKALGSIQIKIPPDEEILSAAAYKKLNSGLDDTSRKDLTDAIQNNKLVWNAPEAGWLVTVVTSQPYDLDYLNGLVVNQWLEIFLHVYEQKLSSFVGNTLTVYGPDEMHVLDKNILYSASFRKRFKAEKGYDFSPYLTGLFHDIGKRTDKIRCDYYDVMVSLLEENFYKPISQWLHKRGMLYATIATLGLRDILGQTCYYGDFFRMMRWFDVPGNEDPGLTKVGERCFIEGKLSSSVAHLYQRKRVAACVYWGSGWGVSQEQNLAWTNENYAYGINLYNRHGVLYSTLGGWYEWAPPAIHFRQPYWQYWKPFTDYIKRLSYIMSQGVHRADIALFYPITTIHANWLANRGFSSKAEEAASLTLKLASLIYRSGIDFDFVDYSSLCCAKVENGKLKVSGLEFRALVLPPMTTIRTESLEKIKEFYDSGGTVIAFRRLPNASAEKGRNDQNIRSMLKKIFGIASTDEFNIPSPTHGVIDKRIDFLKHENKQKGKAFFIPGDENLAPKIISTAFLQDVVVSREYPIYSSRSPVTLERDLFHTHQKVGDVNVYFLFNVKPEARRLSFTFRVCGEPEIWDAFTGEARPVHRFEHQGETTKVRLKMDPYQGVLLVFVPSSSRAEVLDDNLAIIAKVEPGKEQVNVQGFYDAPGKKKIYIRYKKKHYISEARVDAPPEPIVLSRLWDFCLEPTMNNQWGDFRYPASSEMIGAEARRFKYMEEGKQRGIELMWHEQKFDDSNWPEFTYSFGPYWYAIGPFEEGKESNDLLEKAIAGEIDLTLSVESGGRSFQWERYNFSKKYGYEGKHVHNKNWALCGVSENFLVFDAVDNDRNFVRYLFTYVYSPERCDLVFNFGGKAQLPRQAWINGKQIISVGQEETEALETVRLNKGWSSVLLRIIQPKGKRIETFAVFFSPSATPSFDPYVPLLRWFIKPQKLTFDITPKKKNRVGWYRFAAPPGLQSVKINLKGRGVQAWVNGKPVTVREGKITLTSPMETVSQVALRVVQEPGCYAGAVFSEPIAFECEQGKIPLGDWSNFALTTYSGSAVYTKRVTLEKCHLNGKILLDLGQVSTIAEVYINEKSAGIRMGRPYHFDITKLIREGENQIRVKVTNTLANHYAVGYPSKYVYDGQTVSGLVGPVKIQFLSMIDLAAVPVS